MSTGLLDRTAAMAPLGFGATPRGNTTEFRLWAPAASSVRVRMEHFHPNEPTSGSLGAPLGEFPMRREAHGIFTATAPVAAGERYFYLLGDAPDARPVPDPVSRLLPQGVHGPTEIVDPEAFRWSDSRWPGLALNDYVIYELHVGAFTPQGTLDGVIEKLEYLKRLGVTVLELMPVAAFAGTRNWGYDAVSPYAVQASYGGPDGLKRLIDAAHAAGLGVALDVVYNHLGPEGNYLRRFGPYFTNRHSTPWGEAIDYDGPESEGVRAYFIRNALYWVREYHVDALRLDAIQTIRDDSPQHIVSAIRDQVGQLASELGRSVCVIAESDENNPMYVRPKSGGGFGLDAIWSDDFHHALHTVLTGEDQAYYQDFGRKEQVVRALNQGFVFQGECFKYWGRSRGAPADDVPLPRHVFCVQNHDQVGNRAKGERLSHLLPTGARQLAATLLLLAPETPMVFMGEEYGEISPFQFFTDYADPILQKAVTAGRRHEFKEFSWTEVPDPQDPRTFERSRLHWELASDSNGMLAWYRELLALRRRLVIPNQRTCRAELRDQAILMQVPADAPRLMVVAEFPHAVRRVELAEGDWKLLLESDQDGYGVRVYERK